jgi:hypothetical protein
MRTPLLTRKRKPPHKRGFLGVLASHSQHIYHRRELTPFGETLRLLFGDFLFGNLFLGGLLLRHLLFGNLFLSRLFLCGLLFGYFLLRNFFLRNFLLRNFFLRRLFLCDLLFGYFLLCDFLLCDFLLCDFLLCDFRLGFLLRNFLLRCALRHLLFRSFFLRCHSVPPLRTVSNRLEPDHPTRIYLTSMQIRYNKCNDFSITVKRFIALSYNYVCTITISISSHIIQFTKHGIANFFNPRDAIDANITWYSRITLVFTG